MVKLNLDRHTAWRRVITPVDITFIQLHIILQAVFGWKSYHMYDSRFPIGVVLSKHYKTLLNASLLFHILSSELTGRLNFGMSVRER